MRPLARLLARSGHCPHAQRPRDLIHLCVMIQTWCFLLESRSPEAEHHMYMRISLPCSFFLPTVGS